MAALPAQRTMKRQLSLLMPTCILYSCCRNVVNHLLPVVAACDTPALQRGRQRIEHVGKCFRGGATNANKKDLEEEENEEENALLDAYIEELLATVDDEETTQQYLDDIYKNDGHKEEEASVDMDLVEEEEQSSSQEAMLVSSSVATIPSAARRTQKEKTDKPVQHDGDVATEVDKSESSNGSAISPTSEDEEVNNNIETPDVGGGEEELSPSLVDKSVPSNQTLPSDSPVSTEKPVSSATTTRKAPTKAVIPNPLFRFLLHRGKIGQVILMILVLWLEWLAIYLPSLSRSLDWVYVHTIPRSIREPRHLMQGAGGGRRRQRLSPSTTASTLARTGTSRQKQRELTRQADQVAMQQLRALDSNSRYRHVSTSFLQRHKLGPFQNTNKVNGSAGVDQQSLGGDGTLNVVPHEDDHVKRGDAKQLTSKKQRNKKLKSVEEEEDWVVKALTKNSPKLRPTLSFQFGNGGGLSVGLELGTSTRDRYRTSVVSAVHKTPPMPPRSKRSEASAVKTNDAAGGLMGKLRAAAGSSVSRSLLGAYPGDAVPVDEAADVHGLGYLTERYGYGDMSDESEEEDDAFGSFRFGGSKTRKRRKISKPKSTGTSSVFASVQSQRRSSFQRPMEGINRIRLKNQSPFKEQHVDRSPPRKSSETSGLRPMDRINRLKSSQPSASDMLKKTVPKTTATKMDEVRKRQQRKSKSED